MSSQEKCSNATFSFSPPDIWYRTTCLLVLSLVGHMQSETIQLGTGREKHVGFKTCIGLIKTCNMEKERERGREGSVRINKLRLYERKFFDYVQI